MNRNQLYPLVSIIIPTRDRPEMLIRAIKSIACQTYKNIELIVVDDGAEDALEETIRKEIEGKMVYRVLRNARKLGAAGARNTGFFASKGEFVGFLDDDDEWLPKKIVKQVEAFQRSDNKVGIVWTQYINVLGTTQAIERIQLEGNVYAALCKAHIAGNTSIPLIKRHALEEVGLFDESFPAAQDTDLWIRIAKHYYSTTVDEPLALIHRHSSERITNNNQKQFLGAYALLCKHWKEFPIQRKYKLIKRIIRKGVATLHEQLCRS
jgi:glycosyltransferase involved in cell wall biosynthesis